MRFFLNFHNLIAHLVASTQMNATSSRAHTVVTIEFVQKKMQDGKEMAKTSVMNLVDLGHPVAKFCSCGKYCVQLMAGFKLTMLVLR